MKAKIAEYEGCFQIELDAETLEDAALIVRLGRNRTKELRSLNATASPSGGFVVSLVIGKRKDASSLVSR